jgi:hypothetical protein
MNGRTYAEWLIVLQYGKNTVRLKENAAKGPAANDTNSYDDGYRRWRVDGNELPEALPTQHNR